MSAGTDSDADQRRIECPAGTTGASPTAEYVVTAPRSGQPYNRTRLSPLARAALIRSGMDDVTLRNLRMDCGYPGGRREPSGSLSPLGILHYLERGGGAAERVPHHCVQSAEADDPPDRQETVILEYLDREGFAYRQDIARILRIDASQCRPILQK